MDAADGDFSAVLDAFATSEEAEGFVYTNPETGDDCTNTELVNNIYQNVLGREADEEGRTFYVDGLESGEFTTQDVVKRVIDGIEEGTDDADTFNNKVEVAQYFTDNLGDKAYEEDAILDARDLLSGVDETEDSVAAGEESADDLIAGLEEGDGEGDFILTNSQDTLTGTDEDDVFVAPVTQNETGSGELANTFETGDVLDGGEGTNVLEADLIGTGTIQDDVDFSAPISATTTNIQEVYFRAQQQNAESTIDAERMDGVEQWWSDNSRADVFIEDIRSRPDETAVGMRETDPTVNYGVFFNPLYLEGDVSQTDSKFTFTIQDITDDADPAENELGNISVRELNFTLDGTDYTLDTEDMCNSGDTIRNSSESMQILSGI